MKRCPECRRDYYDDSLLYCLDDGTALLEGPGGFLTTAKPSDESAATIMLHTKRSPSPEHLTPTLRQRASVGEDRNAIAVLPFANLSRGEDSEYFSDGLADELLNVLSKIDGVRVAARTSAFSFKGKQVNVKEIGNALQVQSVLEGSVRMAGQRVRIAVQLVDAANGYHLWSATYDRTMDDIFAIQDDIARSVVGELRERFLGESHAQENVADQVKEAVNGRAADPEAHRLMLLGKYLLDRQNHDDATKAAGYFRQALDIDPDYALCWSELGRAYFTASGLDWYDLDRDFLNAEKVLRRALDLDPELAEAHALLGSIRVFRDGDFAGAERCSKRALRLAPDSVSVMLAAGHIARCLGQFETAVRHCRRAAIVDPLSPHAWSASAQTSFLAGDLGGAELALRRTLEIAPQRVATHAWLGLAQLFGGHPHEALSEALLEADTVWRPWSLAIIYHSADRTAESELQLADLIANFSANGAFQIAEVHSMLGNADKGFEWLERAIEQRDPGRFYAKVTPFLAPLHEDPRWKPLLRRLGFPDVST